MVIILLILFGLLLMYRGSNKEPLPPAPRVTPVGAVVDVAAPLGLPPVPIPADNPPTEASIQLGRRLYYDPVLSVDKTVACASCHHPDRGFADNKPFSEGVGKKLGGRNSPTVFNAAYSTTQFWDGRAPSLEEQAKGPVQNPVEMAHTLAGVEQRLHADATYKAEFDRAFGPGAITYEKVAYAIASFERTVLSGNSPFDRYYYGGDKKALSPAAIRGFQVFRRADKGNCAACHEIADKYALFTDNKFHNLGVGVKDEMPTDLGRYAVTKVEADKGCFKTPSLRNVAQTAPYMHDGSLKDLKQVVDFYIGGGNSNPFRDAKIKPLDFLTGQERADLLEFLKSLTGKTPPDVGSPTGKVVDE
jgi:cytochrome c peroxidase